MEEQMLWLQRTVVGLRSFPWCACAFCIESHWIQAALFCRFLSALWILHSTVFKPPWKGSCEPTPSVFWRTGCLPQLLSPQPEKNRQIRNPGFGPWLLPKSLTYCLVTRRQFFQLRLHLSFGKTFTAGHLGFVFPMADISVFRGEEGKKALIKWHLN